MEGIPRFEKATITETAKCSVIAFLRYETFVVWSETGSAGQRQEVLVRDRKCWSETGSAGQRQEVLVRDRKCWSKTGSAGQRQEVLVKDRKCWSEIPQVVQLQHRVSRPLTLSLQIQVK